jgi:hypothetical protein
MLDQEIEEQVLPTIEDLALEYLVELEEDTILQKNSKATKQGWHDLWQIELKG